MNLLILSSWGSATKEVCSIKEQSERWKQLWRWWCPKVSAFAWCLLRLSQQLSKVSESARRQRGTLELMESMGVFQKVELIIPAITSLIQKLNYHQTFSPIFGVLLEACLITRQYDHPSLGLVLDIIFLDVKTVRNRQCSCCAFADIRLTDCTYVSRYPDVLPSCRYCHHGNGRLS